MLRPLGVRLPFHAVPRSRSPAAPSSSLSSSSSSSRSHHHRHFHLIMASAQADAPSSRSAPEPGPSSERQRTERSGSSARASLSNASSTAAHGDQDKRITNRLIRNASAPRISPPDMAPVHIHAHTSSGSNSLPRPPPPAHIAPDFAIQHHTQTSSGSFSSGGAAAAGHVRQHSLGRPRTPQPISRPGSPAVSRDGHSSAAPTAGPSTRANGHLSPNNSPPVSDRSGLKDDGVLRTPESLLIHEDGEDQPVRAQGASGAGEDERRRWREGGAQRRPSPAGSAAPKLSPLRGGAGLGVLGPPAHLASGRPSSSAARLFSAAAFPAPHLSPSEELSSALAQAQDDIIPMDKTEPLPEVSPPPSASTPSFWDAVFPVPTLLQTTSRRSSTADDTDTKGKTPQAPEARRNKTLDSEVSAGGGSTLFSASTFSIPSWFSPLNRSPSATPKPGGSANAPSDAAGSDSVSPSEGNPTFLETVTRLRSLLGLSENEAPGDWVRSHRATLDDVVRRAERDEALEMAKRRAEALRRSHDAGALPVGSAPSSSASSRKSQRYSSSLEDAGDGRYLVGSTSESEGTPQGKASEGEPEEQILRMQEEWRSPRLPIVFCHGLFGFDVLGPRSVPALTINYWRGIIDILRSNGTDVLVTRVPMSASIADRAEALREQIEAHFEEGQEINLIGHSMGGLDSRYLISKLGLGKEGGSKVRVRSLTTIATPHRGSSFADYMLDEVIGKDRLPFLLNALDRVGIPGGGAAFENLTQRSMARFNDDVPDCDGVQYFSWGAAFQPGLFNEFRIPHGVIYAKEGANDGLVSVQSSMWGQYQGTLRGVSHLHLIGWVSAAQNAWRDLVGRRRVFEPAAFYLQIAEDLALAGF